MSQVCDKARRSWLPIKLAHTVLVQVNFTDGGFELKLAKS